jgi:hypothetical protein
MSLGYILLLVLFIIIIIACIVALIWSKFGIRGFYSVAITIGVAYDADKYQRKACFSRYCSTHLCQKKKLYDSWKQYHIFIYFYIVTFFWNISGCWG